MSPEPQESIAEAEKLSPDELTEAWPALSTEERMQGFVLLSPHEAEVFVTHLSPGDAEDLIRALPREQQRRWLRLLPPDDVADVIQEAPEEERAEIVGLLDPPLRDEVRGLLAYAEDVAGGLMNPRYARLRADMTVSQAIAYLRTQKSHNAENIYYGYVVNGANTLVGVVSFRQLVMAPPDKRIDELMTTDLVTVPDTMDQEAVSHIFAHHDLYCIPVVDAEGRMKGIVTADDIVDVVKEEATEDMQKMGGTEALDEPYLQAKLTEIVKKRVVWLIALLLLGFFTVELMSRYQARLSAIAEFAVLLFFVPLIISCGGNSGSQASTLVVRAMALGEVRLRDWLVVVRREVLVGIGLGLIMGCIGLLAALLWNIITQGRMGEHYFAAALAVATGIVCVALWGTLAGSMLPFLLRWLKADPASASAPLVATLVDASGLAIYFTVAGAVLRALGSLG
ncbi:MAG: magnesium transporter [Planctomycetota bacterium]